MRDGATLNATLYGPTANAAPLPVVFELTPYISDTYHDAEHPSALKLPVVRPVTQ
jgi:predicted acyl esterase